MKLAIIILFIVLGIFSILCVTLLILALYKKIQDNLIDLWLNERDKEWRD